MHKYQQQQANVCTCSDILCVWYGVGYRAIEFHLYTYLQTVKELVQREKPANEIEACGDKSTDDPWLACVG